MKRLSSRRGLLVVAVVLLVAVAGCSGLSGDATPTAQPENATETAENATATPTSNSAPDVGTATPDDGTAESQSSTGSETPTDDSETDQSDTADSSLEVNGTGADLDGTALNDATAAAVEGAGSYTYSSSYFFATETRRGQSLTQLITTIRADLDAEQGLRITDQSVSSQQYSQNSTTTVYTEDNTSYQERVTNRGTNYSTQEGEPTGLGGIGPVNTTHFDQNLTFVTDGLVWEENTTTTIDGDTVTRYDLAGVENASAFTGGPDATLTDVGGTLYVDEDDVVRRVSIVTASESDSGTTSTQIRLSLSEIGSTTVEEPDWTSEAEDADSS